MRSFEINPPGLNKPGMVNIQKERFETVYDSFVKKYLNFSTSELIPFFSDQIDFTGVYQNNFQQNKQSVLSYINFSENIITRESFRKFYAEETNQSFLSFSQFDQFLIKNNQQSFLKSFLIKTYWIKENDQFKILNFDVSQISYPMEGNDFPSYDKEKQFRDNNNIKESTVENHENNSQSKNEQQNKILSNSHEVRSLKKDTNMYETDNDWNAKLNLNVLLVDDKPVNLKIIALMLEAASCKVDIASNGLEALQNFAPGKHQVILMDIMMPVMDGITSMKELRKKYDTELPPVIAITANAMRGDKEKYLTEGFDAYIAKPVTMNKLLTELRQLNVINNNNNNNNNKD